VTASVRQSVGVLLIFAVLTFAALPAAAEKWRNLVENAGRAFSNGEYIAAEKILRDAFEEAEILHPKGPQGAVVLNNLAIVLQSRGDVEGAEAAFKQAVSIWKSRLGPKDINVAKTLHNLAELKMTGGSLESALKLYEEAVEIAERYEKSDPTTFARVLEGYANVLFDLGSTETSAKVRDRMNALPNVIRTR
jgi:tetratricopeptide (TPR) repeat protein